MALQRDILAAGNSAESAKAFVGHVLKDLTATGVDQASALEILRPISVFTTVASGAGARLPWTPNKGDQIVISNKGASDLLVYPPEGGTIDGAAVNVPFVNPVGKSVVYWCTDADTWIVLAQLPIPAPPTPYVLTVEDEGVPVGGPINNINFVGAGVTAAAVGPNATVTVPGGAAGCPIDLSAIVLAFGSPPDPNTVIQYDITFPGVASARTLDAATLGTGTVTYVPHTFDSSGPSAIWNARNDKMYFLAEKTDSVGPVVTEVLVEFNPRTLAISGEMVLPASWTAANSILVDVADEMAWISSAFDATLRAFDIVSFTEVFNDGGALTTLTGGVTSASIACNSGQLLVPDATSPVIIHLITITSASAFIDTALTAPGALGNAPQWANNGPLRRRWIMDRNKVVLCYNGLGAPGVRFSILDLNDLTFEEFRSIDVPTNNGTYWDPYAQRVVSTVNDSGGDFGIFIGDDIGGTLGVAARNNGDWSSGPIQTLGGLAWAQSTTFLGFGGFDENVPAFTPAETYETTDSFTSPGGNVLTPGNEVISLRRKDCLPITAPQRGGNEWAPPVFHSYMPFTAGSTGQTFTGLPVVGFYFNAIDTEGWFDVAVGNPGGSVYTPKIRGYYAVEFGMSARASTGPSTALFQVNSPSGPGADFELTALDSTQAHSGSASDIVHCNGSTDNISINCVTDGVATWQPAVDAPYEPNGSCYFNVWLLRKD